MDTTLAALCESFIVNRDQVKAAMAWESPYLYPVCAAIFTDRRQRADADTLRRCHSILKQNTGIFSSFRGSAEPILVTLMALDAHPEDVLKGALSVYEALKEYFFGSQYLPVAAAILAGSAAHTQYQEIAGRTRHIYDQMKQAHPFLTGGEDSVFAALLALSGQEDEALLADAEACYTLLKPEFFSANAVQALSLILALGEGAAEEKVQKTLDLFQALKDAGRKYGTGYELGTLGVLALLPAERARLVADMLEVDAFLADQRGYGFFGVGRQQRLMHAGMLVTSSYLAQTASLSAAATAGAISLIAAQQAALCATIAAASAAAAASASSGGD